MKTGDHKILAGLILASIHINLFHVMLLPPCIGFLILYIGILQKLFFIDSIINRLYVILHKGNKNH